MELLSRDSEYISETALKVELGLELCWVLSSADVRPLVELGSSCETVANQQGL
jgi:hypothetical protein